MKNFQFKYLKTKVENPESIILSIGYIACVARALEALIRNEISCKIRSIELNRMQRSVAHIVSASDIHESMMIGQKSLTCALNGETGKMVAIKRISGLPYHKEFISVPITEVANHKKTVPFDWIISNGRDVTEELISYLMPLIQGETKVVMT